MTKAEERLRRFAGITDDFTEQEKFNYMMTSEYKKDIEEVLNRLKEAQKIINLQLTSNTNLTRYTDEMCLRDILKILDGDK